MRPVVGPASVNRLRPMGAVGDGPGDGLDGRDPGKPGRDLGQPVGAPCVEDEGPAALGQRCRQRAAQSRGRAGDEGNR